MAKKGFGLRPKTIRVAIIDAEMSLNWYYFVNSPDRAHRAPSFTLRIKRADELLKLKESAVYREFYKLFSQKMNESSFQLYPEEFGKSVKFLAKCKEGQKANFFIFTCTCGDPGCAGWFDGVRVEKRGEEVMWTFPDLEQKFKSQTIVVFPIAEYRAFWNRFQKAIKLHKDNKDSEIVDLFHPWQIGQTKLLPTNNT